MADPELTNDTSLTNNKTENLITVSGNNEVDLKVGDDHTIDLMSRGGDDSSESLICVMEDLIRTNEQPPPDTVYSCG